ncbi:MAG: hypothetical protein KF845_07550 [Cyclobacteriaceae bacterium]|nr:hypothetical protein [Cyclobacteriaceae bacterium]
MSRNTIIIVTIYLLILVNTNAQDIQVDHYSGKPLIRIPVYTMNDRSLSHDVSLSYDASGLKVNSTSGLVGVNWSLVAGGEVRRELRSLPDDYYSTTNSKRGWLFTSNSNSVTNAVLIGNHSFPADGAGLSCSTEPTHYNFINGFNSNTDTEPDLFHFNAGSLSGTFVFDNTGNIVNVKTVPYEELKINAVRATSTSPISSIEITDSNGTKYTFSVQETTARSGGSGAFYFKRESLQFTNQLTYTSSWKLSKIESARSEAITFSYTSVNFNSSTPVEVAYPDASPPGYMISNQYNIITTGNRQILTSISTPHQNLNFEVQLSALTADGRSIKKIYINEINQYSSTYVKSYDFIYASVVCNADPNASLSKLFLKEIKISDACEAYQPYRFFYDGINASYSTIPLPSPGSKHQDIWGFYKENSSDDLIPTLYVYPSQAGIHRVSIFKKTGASDEITIQGADRTPSTISSTGTLSKIIYPSGAVNEFTYEPHDFYNPITNSTTIGIGLRIKNVRVHDGITYENDIIKTFEYKKEDGTSSGKLMSLPSFWHIAGAHRAPNGTMTSWATLATQPVSEQWRRLLYRTPNNINPNFEATNAIGYERVTEKIGTGKGKTVYTFDAPNPLGASSSGDWNPTYSHVARSSSCPAVGLNSPGFYNAPFPYQTPFDYARGLPVRISYFAENDNAPVKEVVYTYTDKAISNTTIKGLNYEWVRYTNNDYYFVYGVYKLSVNKLKVLNSLTERVRDKQNPALYVVTITNLAYGSTAHPFATSVTTVESNGDQTITRSKYVKDYTYSSTASSNLQVSMIDKMYEAGRTGTLIEQTRSVKPVGGSEKTIEGKLYLFDNFSSNPDVILPAQSLVLDAGNGVTGFTMSGYSGSGASRTFQKNPLYRAAATYKHNSGGDLIRLEDNRRQFAGFHTDNQTGLRVLSVQEAEPHEVIYSSFDHDTDFDFDLVNFTTADKNMPGRTGLLGLGGWKAGAGKYLKKTLTKKPGKKYVFSAWYKPPVSTGTHSLNVVVKNTSNVQLMQQSVSFTVAAANEWYFKEAVVDLSSIGNTTVVIEVHFSGTYSSTGSSVLDEVIFSPEGSEIARNTYQAAFGITSAVSPEGRITEYEYNPAGKLRYVRDHDRNIVQKTSHTSWTPGAPPVPPILIGVPPGTIHDNTQVIFTAFTGCLDVSSIQWKVSPASDTASGSFFTGSYEQPVTFTSGGSFMVKLKVLHPSYGSYERFVTVNVQLKPLEVFFCTTGATSIEMCFGTATGVESCSGPPPSSVDINYTSFTASPPTGCGTGGSYSYTWYKRPLGGAWVSIGTGISVTVTNNLAALESYEIKCAVTSNCGRTGESGIKPVTIYKMDPLCEAQEN